MTMQPTIAVGSSARDTGTIASRLALPVFAATLFLSAFLLFSVQPFFAKLVLPRLGGSPGVWSVAMVFFQTMLLFGYGYAHLLSTRLSLRNAAIVHLAVMATALAFLPVEIPAGWSEPPQTGQTLWLLGLFTVSIGLPFFAVSANGPLLQAWFSKTGHRHAADPYFLYGASNIGSFASLILYIIVLEPLLTVTNQSLAWSGGFVALGFAIAGCGFLVSSNKVVTDRQPAASGKGTQADWPTKLRWVGLSAVPSGLLVAVTAHVSMDIAAAPFLWVIPLALFLLTFVLAFARKPVFTISTLSSLLPPLAALVFFTMVMGSLLPVWFLLVCHLGFFFLAALLAHSVLVSHRPDSNGLTEFYMWMSLGGVIGGAFTSLVSPVLFNWVAEYPLLIVAALMCRPQAWTGNQRETRIFIWLGLLIALSINNPLIAAIAMPKDPGFYALCIAAFAMTGAVIRLRSEALHGFFVVLVAGLFFASQAVGGAVSVERSFFGVVKAFHTPDGRFTVMAHGTTAHGAIRNNELTGKPTPLSYYHESLGIASALFAAQEKLAGKPAQMATIGLGAGAILCHRKPGETWTSYEIDQAVVDMAADPKLFRFVSNCGNGDPVILGDARLTLAKEPAGKFDYLLIDAFSSDSIPVHLLTVEALELYRSKLQQGGILAIHISNRYMELQSVVAALARETGMTGRAGIFHPPAALAKGEQLNASEVVVLANSEAALGSIAADPRWKPLAAGDTTAWTDNYSNVLAAIARRF